MSASTVVSMVVSIVGTSGAPPTTGTPQPTATIASRQQTRHRRDDMKLETSMEAITPFRRTHIDEAASHRDERSDGDDESMVFESGHRAID
jgi:hypothetical protein